MTGAGEAADPTPDLSEMRRGIERQMNDQFLNGIDRLAALSAELDVVRAERDQARAAVAAVEALLTEPSPAKFNDKGYYLGRVAGTDHRTVGKHRAWCYQCSEWCWPSEYACPCCEPKIEPNDLRAALASLPDGGTEGRQTDG